MAELEDPAVSRFREYLRIKTISTKDSGPEQPDYGSAVQFLRRQAEDIGLQSQVIELHANRPVIVLSWQGRDPALPSIMLYSHMDVVPVEPEQWEADPFSAHKRPNGDILARGAQDMKCVGTWYLEAVRRLKEEGVAPLRSIHLTYAPDEEIGGVLGMEMFVKREEFRALNVGFCLDEGLANPNDAYTVFYGERGVLWFDIVCTGTAGHGARFIEDLAVEKVHKLMSSILDYREQQKKKLNSDPKLKLGDVTSVNVNVVKGGVQHNVVPSEFTISVDMRISPFDKNEDIEKLVNGWVESVGGQFSVAYKIPSSLTSIGPESVWWSTFQTALAKSGRPIEPEIFPAGTDSRFLRALKIPALGFSAMRSTPILLHDKNEFLNEAIYLEGIPIYMEIIQSLANLKN